MSVFLVCSCRPLGVRVELMSANAVASAYHSSAAMNNCINSVAWPCFIPLRVEFGLISYLLTLLRFWG